MSLCRPLSNRPRHPDRDVLNGLCWPYGCSEFPPRPPHQPYYELPLPVTKRRPIVHFRVDALSLPIEQGRIGMPHCRCQNICEGARFVPPVLWTTSAPASLIALIFRAFDSSMQNFPGCSLCHEVFHVAPRSAVCLCSYIDHCH